MECGSLASEGWRGWKLVYIFGKEDRRREAGEVEWNERKWQLKYVPEEKGESRGNKRDDGGGIFSHGAT